MVSALASLFGIALASSVSGGGQLVALDAWVPLHGDRVVIDTKDNVGYIVHENGDFTSFPVLTGQRRVVRYIGRTYHAATPEKIWSVKHIETKGRSMTFGEKGTFLRLWDGNERTAYGIHSHLTFQKMLEEGDRYRSMGCVLVSEEILSLIVATFTLNGDHLDIATRFGITQETAPIDTLASKPSWLGL